jgi:hypothetical protein
LRGEVQGSFSNKGNSFTLNSTSEFIENGGSFRNSGVWHVTLKPSRLAIDPSKLDSINESEKCMVRFIRAYSKMFSPNSRKVSLCLVRGVYVLLKIQEESEGGTL